MPVAYLGNASRICCGDVSRKAFGAFSHECSYEKKYENRETKTDGHSASGVVDGLDQLLSELWQKSQ